MSDALSRAGLRQITTLPEVVNYVTTLRITDIASINAMLDHLLFLKKRATIKHRTMDGRYVFICDLDDTHLVNILKCLVRGNTESGRPSTASPHFARLLHQEYVFRKLDIGEISGVKTEMTADILALMRSGHYDQDNIWLCMRKHGYLYLRTNQG